MHPLGARCRGRRRGRRRPRPPGVDLAERDALALDVDRAVVGAAGADVAERQILVARASRGSGWPTPPPRPARRVRAAAGRPGRLCGFERHGSLRCGGRIVGMGEAEHHRHVLRRRCWRRRARSPAGMNSALPAGERHRSRPSRRSSPAPESTYATSSVSWQTIAVTQPGREHRVAERGRCCPTSDVSLSTIRLQLPPGQRDRLDVLERDHRDRSCGLLLASQHPLRRPCRIQRPLSTICIEASRTTPSRCSDADVLAARIGVVVVAERAVDGADAALLRRRAERRDLADAEGELADHRRVLDALDHLAQPARVVAALDLDRLAAPRPSR